MLCLRRQIISLLKEHVRRLRFPSDATICSCDLKARGYSRSALNAPSRRPGVIPVFLQAENFLEKIAIIDRHKLFTYADLLHHSSVLSKKILQILGSGSSKDHLLTSQRIAILCENDTSYVVSQWAVWMAGGVAVPLCKTHPVSELEYFINNSDSSLVLASEDFEEKAIELGRITDVPVHIVKHSSYLAEYHPSENKWFQSDVVVKKPRHLRVKNRYDDLIVTNGFKKMPAMIVYTSGTTGPPKGVVLTFGNLNSWVESMIQCWGWKQSDVILHVLPLHHVHGIVNTLITPLHCGATCVMMPKFDPRAVWSKLLNPVGPSGPRINLFMAVPTVYAKLLENYEALIARGRGSRWMKEYVRSICLSRIRLMVSGSAALPQPIMDKWAEITGHNLLERYGMTEIGMALSNPLHGNRIPGSVGTPMAGVEVCIAKNNVYAKDGYDVITRGNARGSRTTPGLEGKQGELMIKGPGVFSEYFNKPAETKASFTRDGWFKTGDTAVYEDGIYKIVGRTSVDVIKSGGYKISALDVERHLLAHPDIIDCAVLGLPDITWGQKVAVVVVFKEDKIMSLDSLREWAKDKMATYSIPTIMKVVPAMPRSPIGKVNKKQLLADLFPKEAKRVL